MGLVQRQETSPSHFSVQDRQRHTTLWGGKKTKLLIVLQKCSPLSLANGSLCNLTLSTVKYGLASWRPEESESAFQSHPVICWTREWQCQRYPSLLQFYLIIKIMILCASVQLHVRVCVRACLCSLEGFVSILECQSIHSLQQSVSASCSQSIDLSGALPTLAAWCDVKAK